MGFLLRKFIFFTLYFPYSFPIPLSKVYRRDTEQMSFEGYDSYTKRYTKGIQIVGV